jgi:hypothetical protein
MRNQGAHSTPPSYESHFAKNSRRGRIKRRKINSDRPVVAQEHPQPNHAQQRDRVEVEEARPRAHDVDRWIRRQGGGIAI